MPNYRKIYEDYYGEIPVDSAGRTYEIHHVDGDDNNDSPENLIAVSIQEHYDIHYKQGDWGACFRIAKRLDLSHEEKSELARRQTLNRIEEGTHPWLRRDDGTSNSSDRVKNGSHNLLRRSDGTSHMSDRVVTGTHPNKIRITDRTHNFLTNNPTKTFWHCIYCNRDIGGRSNYNRWYSNKCKYKGKDNE